MDQRPGRPGTVTKMSVGLCSPLSSSENEHPRVINPTEASRIVEEMKGKPPTEGKGGQLQFVEGVIERDGYGKVDRLGTLPSPLRMPSEVVISRKIEEIH